MSLAWISAEAAGAGQIMRVGPGQEYATPAAAAMVARDNDVVEIEAGDYPGDVAVWRANGLTLEGVRGTARLAANGKSAEGKAIWVIKGNHTTVENLDFSGCHVPDRNGAGIRLEGAGLTVRHCCFHDNEDGILAGANPASDIVIESSEFRGNGAGDGYSHNLYIGQVRSMTMEFCWSHGARAGHLLKSRAQTNSILYNCLMDGPDGNSSYVIDLPNGGESYVMGNVLQHGPRAENGTGLCYAEEGAKNRVQQIYIVNNSYINERKPAGPFLRIAGQTRSVVANNLILGASDSGQ